MDKVSFQLNTLNTLLLSNFLFSSNEAIKHMRNVMSNKTKSRRHDLFLDNKERERCSGTPLTQVPQGQGVIEPRGKIS